MINPSPATIEDGFESTPVIGEKAKINLGGRKLRFKKKTLFKSEGEKMNYISNMKGFYRQKERENLVNKMSTKSKVLMKEFQAKIKQNIR